jgi:hypothetical protein
LKQPGHIGTRVFAVISAFCLVVAFAIGSLFPPGLSLGEMISMVDHAMLVALQNFVRVHVSEWLWTSIAVPILLRPAWLTPTALGLVAAGVAVSLGTRQGAPRSRRRRS